MLILAAGGFYFYSQKKNTGGAENGTGLISNIINQVTSKTPEPVINPGDTSNAALDKDLQNVDSQMNSLNSDVKDSSDSLNDQQVDLSVQ